MTLNTALCRRLRTATSQERGRSPRPPLAMSAHGRMRGARKRLLSESMHSWCRYARVHRTGYISMRKQAASKPMSLNSPSVPSSPPLTEQATVPIRKQKKPSAADRALRLRKATSFDPEPPPTSSSVSHSNPPSPALDTSVVPPPPRTPLKAVPITVPGPASELQVVFPYDLKKRAKFQAPAAPSAQDLSATAGRRGISRPVTRLFCFAIASLQALFSLKVCGAWSDIRFDGWCVPLSRHFAA